MRPVLLLLFAMAVLGCGNGAATSSSGSSRVHLPTSTDLYEQMRSGAFQMGQAQDAIAEALQFAETLPKELGEGKPEIYDRLDTAGEDLSPFAAEPPPEGTFRKQSVSWATRRTEAVDRANDTIRELLELNYLIDDLAQIGPAKLTAPLDELGALIDVAVEALVSAIEAYGGKVEHADALDPPQE